MSQEDYVLADAAGAAFRADANNQLAAIVTLNAGASAPSPTFANQLWIDTTNSLLKKRNNANNAWNTLGSMDTLLATTSLAGLVAALATTTEALTGTNATKAVTPDALAALWEKGADVASASPLVLGEGRYFHVTGTTNFSDLDFGTDKSGRAAWITFDGILTITHNATTLNLPGAANITTAAGDRALFVSEDGSDNVRCLVYQRASGAALVSSSAVAAATQAEMEAGSSLTVFVSPGRQQFHPSASKAWVRVSNSGTPTALASYNVASLTDNGTGDVTVVIATDFSSANYGYSGAAQAVTSGNPGILSQHDSVAPTAGAFRLFTCKQSSGAPTDLDFGIAFFGDQ